MKFEVQETDLFTADQHFHHKGILKYEKNNRPFKDVNEMNEYLVDVWNSIVGKRDRIICLGDIVWGNNPSIIHRLNGEIILLRGNHDNMPEAKYIHAGISRILPGPVKSRAYKVVLSHEPLVQPVSYPHCLNIHGHTHSYGERLKGPMDISIHHYSVSVEMHGFKPVTLKQILQETGHPY
jgi:calcineurin-like phosphoesterase family protein